MTTTKALLDAVFGLESTGTDAASRARTSQRTFVRSQNHVAPFTPGATGRRLNAVEALDTFGFDRLAEAVEFGTAVIAARGEPAQTLRARRQKLGLTPKAVARVASLQPADVEAAEDPGKRSKIRALERIAQALALDDDRLGLGTPDAAGDRLSIRLREWRSHVPGLSESATMALSEAAWVTRRQHQLARKLDDPSASATLQQLGLTPRPVVHSFENPVWDHAYVLAYQTRVALEIDADAPINKLRELVESDLGIPVVESVLPNSLAGATVVNGTDRGIAVNSVGDNQSVWVRRATIAHELGHLLWDMDEALDHLHVDNYSTVAAAPRAETPLARDDRIEARANAFAAEFLAPKTPAFELFDKGGRGPDGVRHVMEHLGVSFSLARFQIWNGSERSLEFNSITAHDLLPTADWIGRESLAEFFVPADVPTSRRGRFAYLVVIANEQGFLSDDTAATLLACALAEFTENRETIKDLAGPG